MKKKTLILIVTICLILLATLGASVALFSYLKEGIDDNSIEVGDITFRYTEVNGIGHGINLEDSFPISDSEGKGLEEYFDFKIDSKLSRSDIEYEVVVEPTSDTTINLDGVNSI